MDAVVWSISGANAITDHPRHSGNGQYQDIPRVNDADSRNVQLHGHHWNHTGGEQSLQDRPKWSESRHHSQADLCLLCQDDNSGDQVFDVFADPVLTDGSSRTTTLASSTSVGDLTRNISPNSFDDSDPFDHDDEAGLSWEEDNLNTRKLMHSPYKRTLLEYFIRELTKEFHVHRFGMNHFEFVDFHVFEYGDRGYYLMWRCFSLLLTYLLGIFVVVPGISKTPTATPISPYIFMHVWLHALLMFYQFLEVFFLYNSWKTFHKSQIAKVHYTPPSFQLLWFLYNTLYPNLMACNFMYYVVLDVDEYVGEYKICTAILSSLSGIHVSVTGTPSRLAHVFQPLAFNLLHILFSLIYSLAGWTDPGGHNYVYSSLDWVNARWLAVGCSIFWLCMTTSSHCLIVACCWTRRLVYRHTRPKNLKCVYGITNREYFKFKEYYTLYRRRPFNKKRSGTDGKSVE